MTGRADRPSAPEGSATKVHLAHLEGLRALAALVVYVNHAYAQAWNPLQGHYPDGPWRVFTYSLVAGHFAVTVFIAVSGFCLALPLVASGGDLVGGARRFLSRRAWRILPPYYAALLVSLVLIWTVIGEPTGSLWDVPIEVDAAAIASHLLLLQDLFRTGRINYVFWSIAVEWHIYLLFPLLVLAARRVGLTRVVIACLLVGAAVSLAATGSRVERSNPHYLGIFALGMLAAHVARAPSFARLRALPVWPHAWACALGAVCLLSVHWGLALTHGQRVTLDLLVGCFACCLLVDSGGRDESRAARLLAWPPLVALGSVSYSLYLVHAPLLQLIWQYLLEPLGISRQQCFSFLLTGGLGLVLVGTYAFFLLFERPFLGRKAPIEWLRFKSAPTR